MTAHICSFTGKKEVHYFHDMVWDAARVLQMFQRQVFNGLNDVTQQNRHKEKMLYDGTGNVVFMQSRAEFVRMRYRALEILAHPMHF